MRISDWSSDVCSSDLPDTFGGDLDDIPEAKPHRRISPRSCAGGGAGDDHVAGLERDEGRNVADQKAKAEDHPRRAVVLPQLAIDPGGEADVGDLALVVKRDRSEEHTSELQSLMRISYAVFCLKQKN